MVKDHIQVQSKLYNGEVGTLSLESDSYHVKRYNDTNAAVRKCKETDLYLLPPAILPNDPIGTMNVRYLNYSNAPIIFPLTKSLKIEMYNVTYFNKQPTSQFSSRDVVSCQLNELVLQSHATPKIAFCDRYIQKN